VEAEKGSPTRYAPQRSPKSPAASKGAKTPRGSLNEIAVWVSAIVVLVLAGVLHFYTAGEAQSASVLPAAMIEELSPYLRAANRDGAGFGPTFFGTVNNEWNRLSTEAQREEVVRIGDRLRWTGVEEVRLLAEGGRLVARYFRGELSHPPPAP
jgi:hypothetical protein